jgi:hypothetical protein
VKCLDIPHVAFIFNGFRAVRCGTQYKSDCFRARGPARLSGVLQELQALRQLVAPREARVRERAAVCVRRLREEIRPQVLAGVPHRQQTRNL